MLITNITRSSLATLRPLTKRGYAAAAATSEVSFKEERKPGKINSNKNKANQEDRVV